MYVTVYATITTDQGPHNMRISLKLGDCTERLHDVADSSVNLVLADPPYQMTSLKWDKMIPVDKMWEHLKRVTVPLGTIVITSMQPFTSKLIMSNLQMFKYCWVWEKNRPSGFAQAKNKPLSSHEDIVVFSDGVTVHETQSDMRMLYNPQGVVDCHMRNSNTNKSGSSSYVKRPNAKMHYTQTVRNYPRTVLKFNSVEDSLHPTQKPVDLMEYLILTYTDKDQTVLDFTMGSGTTGVAAVNTGRKFIGIEQDKKYFKTAKKRIRDTIEKRRHLKKCEVWSK